MIKETTALTANETIVHAIRNFLSTIGIGMTEGEVSPSSFLPAIEIRNGALVYDPEKLQYPGDLLHEAGHIAVTPVAERPTLSGNVIDNDPQKNGDEIAVLLWTYAACLEMKLPPEVVFHPDGYKGESDWIINNFQNGKYVGLPLLVWMGLAHDSKHPEGYPAMIKWLRD